MGGFIVVTATCLVVLALWLSWTFRNGGKEEGELEKERLEGLFLEATGVLDEALALAHPELQREGVRIDDCSNRSGFDKSGWFHFTWNHWFEKQGTDGVYISKAVVHLSFTLSGLEEVNPLVECSWASQVYQLGMYPHFKAGETEHISLADLASTKMSEYVSDRIRKGVDALPERYRVLVKPEE